MSITCVSKSILGVIVVALGVLATSASAQSDHAYELIAQRAAVAADHELASQAGFEMLRAGGNAVDAAVATSFCLAVVRPFSCGLGGGGFMLIYKPGDGDNEATMFAINYREVAPGAVGPEYYTALELEHASRFGPHAVGVPGTVAGLLWALDNFGTLDRHAVLAPAIRAAETGFTIDRAHVSATKAVADAIAAHPELRDSVRYVHDVLCFGGNAEVGDVLRQPALARSLKLIAEYGADAFYHGPIGDSLVKTMKNTGGPITTKDLASYKPRVGLPIEGRFHGKRVLVMPPPSSGGLAMLQTLGLIERAWDGVMPMPLPSEPQALDVSIATSPAYVHLVCEAMKHAFADRAEFLADTKFVPVPIARLLSAAYLDELAVRIGPAALASRFEYGSVTPAAAPAPVDGGTSHFSVIDEHGMAVACTETINLEFGSLLAIEEFGIVLNNEMDDFTTIPGAPNAFGLVQSDRNLPQPGKNPLSSMSPTIVLGEGGAVEMIVGASGGPRIITSTLETILLAMLFDMDAGAAVSHPRFHHQWMPNEIWLEADRWPAGAIDAALAERGHTVVRSDKNAAVQIIRVQRDGLIRAACDPRKGGRPAGH